MYSIYIKHNIKTKVYWKNVNKKKNKIMNKINNVCVSSNFAISIDGRISFFDLISSDFACSADRKRLHYLRSINDAIIIGRNTAERENTKLIVNSEELVNRRKAKGLSQHPVACIVSGLGIIDRKSLIFKRDIPPVLFTGKKGFKKADHSIFLNVYCAENENGQVDPEIICNILYEKHNVKRLMIEGGGTLLHSFIKKNMVNHFYATIYPFLFGSGHAIPIVNGNLNSPERFEIKKIERVDNLVFMHYSKV